MNKKRWLAILKRLHPTETVTSEQLGRELSLSSRTVRSECRELKNVLEKEGAHLISRTNAGYLLQVEDEEKYRRFLRSLEESDAIPETSEERVQYLLEILLANNEEYVKLEDLCDQLYISRSSLTVCLKEVRELLEAYNLKLIMRPSYGIRVEGREFDLRLCLAAYTIDRKNPGDEEKRKSLETIARCIREGLQGSGLRISEVSFQNLIVHIYIALKRLGDKAHVPLREEQLRQIEKEAEFPYAEKIAAYLEKTFDVKIPRTEVGYIAIHLASKRIFENAGASENLVIDDEIYDIVTHMLDAIQEGYNMDFHDDLELRMFLAAHLVPFSVRMQYDMNLKNPMLGEIKSHYTMAYLMATTACKVLEEHYHKHIQEDEIGYFALPISLAMERRRTEIAKKNIVVVCSTGRGSAQLLLYQIQSRFGRYLDRVETCDVLELQNFDLSDIDYIVTTVPIPFSVNRPILHIRAFLENTDVDALQSLLSGRERSSLEKYFHPDLFMAGVEANTKKEAIEAIVAQIARVKPIPEDFLEAVFEREQLAVTAFGNRVAIPHPNRPLTDESFVCVAVLKNPILWGKQKVQLVFMLSLKKNGEDMQYFSSVTSKLLFSREYVGELIRHPSYSTLMGLLEKIEKEGEKRNG